MERFLFLFNFILNLRCSTKNNWPFGVSQFLKCLSFNSLENLLVMNKHVILSQSSSFFNNISFPVTLTVLSPYPKNENWMMCVRGTGLTSVWYWWGSCCIKECAFAKDAALSISSSSASNFPILMLSLMLPANSDGSWETSPIFLLRNFKSRSLMLWLSRRISPECFRTELVF